MGFLESERSRGAVFSKPAFSLSLIMFTSAQKARLYLRRVRSIAKRAASSADPMKRIRGSSGSSPMGARARF